MLKLKGGDRVEVLTMADAGPKRSLKMVGRNISCGVAYPWLCDSMGHMNTQHYCALFYGATFHFLALMGGPRHLKESQRGWVDAKQTIEYRLGIRLVICW